MAKEYKVVGRYRSVTGFYTRALFYEAMYNLAVADRNETMKPVFTLHADVPGLTNFGREYVKDMDTTGITTANRLLDGYPHFTALMKSAWFKEAKEIWDNEIEAILRSNAIKTIREIADNPEDKNALQAAKFLASKGHVDKLQTKGRPTKEAVDAAIKAEVRNAKTLEDDFERITNVVPLGKKA